MAYRYPRRSIWTAPLFVAIGVLCVMIEGVLQASDLDLAGARRWRALAYQYGAFWPGLLHDWRPNFAAQPGVMFVSYAFLHGGLGHLIGNMITLIALGAVALERVGQARAALIYSASALGGAALFGVMTNSGLPMVGASGALFGLAGAWQYWVFAEMPKGPERLWHLSRAAAALIALNIVLWWLMGGRLAWQTHLGGFLTGWVAAVWLTPKPAAPPAQ
ncbi:MAG: rhomboid family intramembrane serine protease [Pseudomonadota bacterium]